MDLEAAAPHIVSRRTILLGAIGLTSASLLAACGGGQAAATATGTPAAPTSGSPAASPTTTAAPAVASAAPTVAAFGGATPVPSGATNTEYKPPAVPNAESARAFGNQGFTYYGDSVGLGAELDAALARQFTADTGIAVNVVPKPQSATETYSAYQRYFQARSADVDVMMVDVIWPGSFASHLADLNEKMSAEAKLHYPGIIENNTIGGKLVALPWFGDFGMLFYRTDLLQAAGISAPPRTWDELQQQAAQVVESQKASNASLVGFVFQGNAYEGVTCNALEWLASSGAGRIIEDGRVTLNNPQTVAMLNRAKGWIGSIAPRGVTSYQEEDARIAFQSGNAVFMRNWPYAYAAGNTDDSPIKGKFDVAPLPAEAGQKSAGTVGGWQLAVSAYSTSQDAAMEFVRYLCSPQVQSWRSVVGSFVPTIPWVAEDAAVVAAMPFLKNLASVERITRPSATTWERYSEVSSAFFQGVNQILNGQDAASILPQTAERIERITA